MGPKYATKRELADIVNQEDSDDDDYDDREQRKPRAKPKARGKRGGEPPPRKKQRRIAYGESDDDEELSPEEEAWTGSSDDDDDNIEVNEAGRPRRRATKQAKTYEESDEDEDMNDHSSSSDEDLVRTPAKSSAAAKSKIVTLKVRTPLGPASSARSLRDRKPSISLKTYSSSTRHTRRTSEDLGDDLIELSSSGRHVVVARAGSREPDIPSRASRASKSIKFPSRSTIDEAEEPESFPKEDYVDEVLEIDVSQSLSVQRADSPEQPELPSSMPRLLFDITAAADQEISAPSEDPLHPSPERPDAGRPEIEPLSDDGEADQAMEGSHHDDDDDEEPVKNLGRLTRGTQKRKAESPPTDEPLAGRRRLRSRNSGGRQTSATTRNRKRFDETSDFEPGADAEEAEELSDSAASGASPRKRSSQRPDDYESSNGGRRSTRLRGKAASRPPSGSDEEEAEELAEELAELGKVGNKRKRGSRDEELVFETRGRRNAGRKNYDLLRNLPQIEEDDEPTAPTPSQRARRTGGGWQRSLFSTYGPFGGAGGRSVFGGPGRPPDADSDSSDDEIMKQPKTMGGAVGMTPTTAQNPFNPFALATINSDPAQATAGTPANLGKIKDRQALADADPLGVDQNVNFDSVGGLQGHIDQLKEMVALPLLYPEIFMRFKITPPRGVLFHGPPGTGKTLLARALATSVSSEGRKVTFYMRKGADALSKWVGEAERQLRLLFEEARKTQPSIIFFDEIDGLAPVRSSKQEQIHASIVSTLLALMDGMDGRGQVIVIGATNRPDSIDPALRRPGRFDREFYFPLPDIDARRSILNIHTKGWDPPLDDQIKDELALLTKGYGGADLRALCTEAALNAVQRRYPQIYSSKEKLLIDPKTIHVTPKDFMISIKKMTPSSERSASSGAASLPQAIAPLLNRSFEAIKLRIAEILPQKKKTTALEEAMFEDAADGASFGRERMQQAFEASRVFRPRLLIHGKVGMGQQYIAAALLNHFQGIHVQSFDLATLLSDTTSSPEATVIRLFAEAKTHKPSVIYIPNVQEWYATVGPVVQTTFIGLLRSIKPTDPIMVMGFSEADPDREDRHVKRELFGYSQRNQFLLENPSQPERKEFFRPLKQYITMRPSEFPDPTHRKKRQIEILPPAPLDPLKEPVPPSKEELKAQKKKDRQTLNLLKIRLQPIMDQIRTRYKKFRTGVIEDAAIKYLFDEADPETVTTDIVQFRPFEKGTDPHGVGGLVDQTTQQFYYNIDSVTIEKRLSNGWYKRPRDFVAEIKQLAKDARAIGDEDRLLKANELLANVEVDVSGIELNEPALAAECERVYLRELQREKAHREKQRAEATGQSMPPPRSTQHSSDRAIASTTDSSGPIRLGETFANPKDMLGRINPLTPSRPLSDLSGITNGFHDARTGLNSGQYSNRTGSGHEADTENEMNTYDSNVNSTSKTSSQPTQTSSNGNTSSAQPRPFSMYTAPSQQLRQEYGIQQALYQTGVVTPMQHGSQAIDYVNEASTTQTTSGKKDSSQPSDRTQLLQNSQALPNSQEHGPNLFMYDEHRSNIGSDIPDTQPTQEKSPTDHSPPNPSDNASSSKYASAAAGTIPPAQGSAQPSASPLPPFGYPPEAARQNIRASAPAEPVSRLNITGTLAKLLNPPSPSLSSQPMSLPRSLPTSSRYQSEKGGDQVQQQQPNLHLPAETSVDNVLNDLVDQSSGLSVEQLEQVNSVLMDILWQTRGEWDRNIILKQVVNGFNDVLADMKEAGQEFGDLSWERDNVRRIGATRRLEG